MGSGDPLEKNGWKIKKKKTRKKEQFSMFMLYFRAIRAGSCRERRYADHVFIQIYFRMHHFVVMFSKFSSPQAARGHWPPNQNPADVPGSSSSGSDGGRVGVDDSVDNNLMTATTSARHLSQQTPSPHRTLTPRSNWHSSFRPGRDGIRDICPSNICPHTLT